MKNLYEHSPASGFDNEIETHRARALYIRRKFDAIRLYTLDVDASTNAGDVRRGNTRSILGKLGRSSPPRREQRERPIEIKACQKVQMIADNLPSVVHRLVEASAASAC